MQNQPYSQYIPTNYGYNQYSQPQAQPLQGFSPQSYATNPYAPSVGAVNIQIYNPTANSVPNGQNQGFYGQTPCAPYPCNYNNMMQYPNQYQYQQPWQQYQQGQTPNPTEGQNSEIAPSVNQNSNLNAISNNDGVAAQGNGQETEKAKDTKDDKKAKPKVALTDDYIKTLENYLNSQDKKIRLMGAKELFERFKEDESRKDDAALTALLNKTLQDPAETVKFIALTALDTGYATGNDETAQILTQMQSSNSSYGEDANLAAKILLKMSGYKANSEAEALQQKEAA